MKKFLMPLLVTCLFFVSGCKDDDDSLAPEGYIEVCAIFAPGELGDDGYADRVLLGLNQFEQQLKKAGDSRVVTHFYSPGDLMAQEYILTKWNENGINLHTMKRYERRLLVLTDPKQLPMVDVEDMDNVTEVLLLNMKQEYADTTALAKVLGSRLYQLNISAAEGGRRLCNAIEMELDDPDSKSPREICYLKKYTDNLQADSLYETVSGRFKADELAIYTMEEIQDDSYGRIGFQFADLLNKIGDTGFLIGNSGFENLGIRVMNDMKDTNIKTFLLDTMPDELGMIGTIVRYYDRALSDWLSRWLAAGQGQMPRLEQHGYWDKYAEDNIKSEE